MIKQEHIISEIYVNHVFVLLSLDFFEKLVEENGDMIRIDDGMAYHTLKFTTKFYQKVDLLYII